MDRTATLFLTRRPAYEFKQVAWRSKSSTRTHNSLHKYHDAQRCDPGNREALVLAHPCEQVLDLPTVPVAIQRPSTLHDNPPVEHDGPMKQARARTALAAAPGRKRRPGRGSRHGPPPPPGFGGGYDTNVTPTRRMSSSTPWNRCVSTPCHTTVSGSRTPKPPQKKSLNEFTQVPK